MISKLLYNRGSNALTPPRGEIYLFENALDVLGLTNSQFVDFCILCGTDFNKNVPGMGNKTHHELILEFGSIPNIIKARDQLRSELGQASPSKIAKLTKFQKTILKFDESHLNYDAVRTFFTSPITYDVTRLKPVVSEEQFLKHRPALLEILGEQLWKNVENYAREMMVRLEKVASELRH